MDGARGSGAGAHAGAAAGGGGRGHCSRVTRTVLPYTQFKYYNRYVPYHVRLFYFTVHGVDYTLQYICTYMCTDHGVNIQFEPDFASEP